jgi:hypothetical protein
LDFWEQKHRVLEDEMMRKLVAALGLMVLPLLTFAPLHAQETTVVVGTAGNITATNSLAGNTSTESLSTAQVDGVLRAVAPGAFGQNFTRDRANKVFGDFARFRANLVPSLITAIQNSDSSIRVNSLIINANALNLRLAQKTNSVTGQLGTVSASISARKDVGIPLFCTSANVSFSLDNIMVSGDYNFITGDVSNAKADFAVNNVSAGCNGLLSFITNFAATIVDVNSLLRDAIKNEANNQLAFVNMKSLFSLSDFVNGLRYYGNETIISVVANRAINVLRELVNDAAINTPNVVLDFGVEFATGVGGQNKISIIASHAPVIAAQLRRQERYVTVEAPAITGAIDVYVRDPVLGDNWRLIGTGSGTSIPVTGTIPTNYQLIAVARSSLIPGLESFPKFVSYPPDPLGFPGTRK